MNAPQTTAELAAEEHIDKSGERGSFGEHHSRRGFLAGAKFGSASREGKDHAEIYRLIDLADRHVCDLASGKANWTMCIPARADDSDLLISDALRKARAALSACEEKLGVANAEERALSKQITECMEFLIWIRGYEYIDGPIEDRLTQLLETLSQLSTQASGDV